MWPLSKAVWIGRFLIMKYGVNLFRLDWRLFCLFHLTASFFWAIKLCDLLWYAPFFLVFCAEFAMPLIFHKASPFSIVTASVLEIRTSTPVVLIIPKSTCELVKEVIVGIGEWGDDSKNKSILSEKKCAREINFIDAQVLSNVGEHWRVKIIGIFEGLSLPSSGITMSIPKQGIHYLNIKHDSKK